MIRPNRRDRALLFASLVLPSLGLVSLAAAPPGQRSPYAELGGRPIKAIGPEEAAGLERGEGMMQALAAELNGYPGPLHVLELREELALTDEQHREVEAIFDAMRAEAARLGREILEREAHLEALFASGAAQAAEVEALSLTIGELRGRLRFAHLAAHLETVPILSDEQRARYQELRGYAAGDGTEAPEHHPGHHHSRHHRSGGG